jgi:dipeptidyl aminopeptidase/acylaminoacyl peptidase
MKAAAVVVFSVLVWTQAPLVPPIDADRADRLTGLYAFEDGARFHVTDLRDLFGGQPTLSITEYQSGRLRALFPRDGDGFSAGSGWFRRDPVTFTVTFDEATPQAASLRWEEAGVRRTALRVAMDERPFVITRGGIRIAGTLTVPPGPGPHPAVVMIPGSGPLTRRTPRYVGDLLTGYGIAVLTVDKRGTGESTGSWNTLSHREWAADVHAQLDWLARQPGINPSRLGIVAGSEGGFVGPVVAAQRKDVRVLVCRVCSALPHPEVILDMESAAMRRTGLAEPDVARASALLKQLLRFALERTDYTRVLAAAKGGEGTTWRAAVRLQAIPPENAQYWDTYRGVLDVDPRDHYRRLTIPVLAILGERDERILVDKHRTAFNTLRAGGVPLTLWVEPGASHGLQLDESTNPRYPAGFHDRLASWVASQLR